MYQGLSSRGGLFIVIPCAILLGFVLAHYYIIPENIGENLWLHGLKTLFFLSMTLSFAAFPLTVFCHLNNWMKDGLLRRISKHIASYWVFIFGLMYYIIIFPIAFQVCIENIQYLSGLMLFLNTSETNPWALWTKGVGTLFFFSTMITVPMLPLCCFHTFNERTKGKIITDLSKRIPIFYLHVFVLIYLTFITPIVVQISVVNIPTFHKFIKYMHKIEINETKGSGSKTRPSD